MPGQTFSHAAVASAPREQVWVSLDLPTTWEGVGGVERVVDPIIDADGRLRGFDFETRMGGRAYRGKATPRERIEGELIGWDVASPDVRGHTEVELSDDPAGTRVQVTVHVEAIGMLATMFFGAIAATIGGGLPDAVEAFAASLGDQPG